MANTCQDNGMLNKHRKKTYKRQQSRKTPWQQSFKAKKINRHKHIFFARRKTQYVIKPI